MDLYQLRCFIAVAEELHFGRAAARLHITQPPLSRQIQLLEKSLGCALFARNNRHVNLTHMGEHVLRESRLILKLADQLQSSAHQRAMGFAGTLRLGFTAVFSWQFIPRLLKQMTARLPGLDFQLYEQVSQKQVSAIAENLIDVGFVRHVPPDPLLTYLPLTRETFVAAFHSEHPLARKRKIPLTAFNNETFFCYSPNEARTFYDRISDLFIFNKITPNYKYEFAQTHTILGMVSAGLGCSIVPASAKTLGFPNISYLTIEGASIQAHNFLVYSKSNPNPALPVFIDAVNAIINEDPAFAPGE
ncbi:LysR family transcriptional regulator [Shimwellia blattae]|uniref:Putative transcriptional regulatory protein n=1 Tax=Shimwellia blattae (strain ATCC 29907 / DSM 4481 / JCM 1650 / NBRC 105725 / CDC 9005-74) TaxID=630626 RepID=I2B834_SHIBC|nr:LysR family transcriptional regulator [Shimwellia blattae]AFJ46688.1 putative transcriptional regulatory protein [Shimwellia blattae DSM 4481 = NBRC 105725]GAB80266.1 putative LysR family transcriptional regulator YnfL [Shimwellia blattae DSM 4481 = NBRC 105725]VDY64164.1 Ben and cat operon transcriptional regulator [Shimwellia blattae]VEC22292.1 Ben and cat operon transcriptional regulator [Shimwellia blattae]